LLNIKNLTCFYCLLLSIVLVQSCAKNRLTSSWVDESFKGPIKGKMLVVGVFKDPTTHKIFENSFVAKLNQAGVDASPSYNYGTGEKRHSKEWLQQIIKESKATTLLFTHLVKESKQTEEMAPHGLILGGAMIDGDLYGYQSYVVGLTLEPGYSMSRTEDFMQASLFDCQTQKPIWKVGSKSVNLNHFLRADDELLEEVYIKNMKQHHLF
jgi:hypothetical protein